MYSLNGLAAGPCETLTPQIIADIIFLHDRGKYQTLYFTAYFISLMVRCLAPTCHYRIANLLVGWTYYCRCDGAASWLEEFLVVEHGTSSLHHIDESPVLPGDAIYPRLGGAARRGFSSWRGSRKVRED